MNAYETEARMTDSMLTTRAMRHAFLAVVVAFTMTGAASALDPGAIVSYWNLDESTGTTMDDLVGSNDGAVGTGATIGQPGKFGNAIEISGGGITGFNATTTGMPFGASAATVSYWVKKNSNGGNQVHYSYGQAFVNGTFRGLFDRGGGSVNFYHWNNDNEIAVPLTTTAWHLVVTVFDPTNLERRTYFDGVLKQTRSDIVGVNVVDVEPFRIGSEPRGFAMNGLIDDMAVWSSALTDAEVTALWNGGNGLPLSSILAVPIPTVSEWGQIVMGLLLLIAVTFVTRKLLFMQAAVAAS